MATEHGVLDLTFSSSADYSAKQFYVMQLNTSGQIVIADATVRVVGILQDTPSAAGMAGTLRVIGVSKAVSDGSGTAIVIMDALASDANGKVVKTTTDNDEIIGFALDASAADGKIIRVLLNPFNRY